MSGSVPFSTDVVALIGDRAGGRSDNRSFGSTRDLATPGIVGVAQAMFPRDEAWAERVPLGGSLGGQLYSASPLNISAMGYGPLSRRAVSAINRGAALGNFAQNTGEEGAVPAHGSFGGHLIYQLGTDYFGCRTPDGEFCADKFAEASHNPQVVAIEIKLSQGGKPGHGGIIPGDKVTSELAEILGVKPFEAIRSPTRHSAFQGPVGLLRFAKSLADLSGGKPVGIKLCVGAPVDFLRLCKSMLDTELVPDFITVDGAEGGTGAAPFEFMHYVGAPLDQALRFVDEALVGAELRSRTKLIASGRIATGFDMFRALALGADLCSTARAALIAMGCAQHQLCHTNACPTGIATQRPDLSEQIAVLEASERVLRFHQATVQSLTALAAAAGLDSTSGIGLEHLIVRRAGQDGLFTETHDTPRHGSLLSGTAPAAWRALWNAA